MPRIRRSVTGNNKTMMIDENKVDYRKNEWQQDIGLETVNIRTLSPLLQLIGLMREVDLLTKTLLLKA